MSVRCVANVATWQRLHGAGKGCGLQVKGQPKAKDLKAVRCLVCAKFERVWGGWFEFGDSEVGQDWTGALLKTRLKAVCWQQTTVR